MNAKLLIGGLSLLGVVALGAPAFAGDASLGMDVAPGGGVYTKQDVSSEEPGRMSQPVVGEQRAPSAAAKGSLEHVDGIEDSITSRLNEQQLNGGQTAAAPGDSE
jgi:hypothetical protein